MLFTSLMNVAYEVKAKGLITTYVEMEEVRCI
jgi:hypothetical protein